MRIWVKKYFILLCITFLFIGVGIVYSDKEEHDFTLNKAERMPYSLQYPIKVEGPCDINVNVRITNADINMENPVSVSIIQKNPHKDWVHAVAKYAAGKNAVELKHTVDRNELSRGQNYSIIVTNFSQRKNAVGRLRIGYYGKNGLEEGVRLVNPDLTISDLRLNDQNMLQVEIVNLGPGRIPAIFYEKNVPNLVIFQDETAWGRASLNIIDPQRKLSEVNGKVVYTFDGLKVTGTEKIKAVIDNSNILPENNEKNNEIRRELTGKPDHSWKDGKDRHNPNDDRRNDDHRRREERPGQGDKTGKDNQIGKNNQSGAGNKTVYPDLAITKVYSNNNNYLVVEIVNNGPGQLSPEYWKTNIPTLYIYRSNQGWCGITLDQLDPDKKLVPSGGKGVYTIYRYRVMGTETVRVVIDSQNTVPESNENNNEMSVTLGYRR
jgi:hypothetical protein